jgi:hypothetical protein
LLIEEDRRSKTKDQRQKIKDKRSKTKDQRQKIKDKRSKTKDQRQKTKDKRYKIKDRWILNTKKDINRCRKQHCSERAER